MLLKDALRKATKSVMRTVLIGSNGINRGCGSIAVSVDELLTAAGYRCVHLSSAGSMQHIRGAGKPCIEVMGYEEKMDKATVNEFGCFVDYVVKNARYLLSEHSDITSILETHNPTVYVSIYEGFGAFTAYYLGIPIVEFSDMLFFKLGLHSCTDTELDHLSSYNVGLSVSMAPYTKGCAVTLYPDDVAKCDVEIPENCVVTGPLLASDVKKMDPVPSISRDHVTVYVSGATDKCEWLYSALSKMPEHRFVVFVPHDEPTTCEEAKSNVTLRLASRGEFLLSLASSYACITNSGLQTAAEAIHLQVPNFMLPTANHHAQCAVSESVQRAGGGLTCLRDTQSSQKQCLDFEAKMRAFLDRCKAHPTWSTPAPPDGGEALLAAVRSCERMDPQPPRAMTVRYALSVGAVVVVMLVLSLVLSLLIYATVMLLQRGKNDAIPKTATTSRR